MKHFVVWAPTPERRQSKTLILSSTNVDQDIEIMTSEIGRNRVFDCH